MKLLKNKESSELIVKTVLIVLLLCSIIMSIGGLWGISKYNSSGFDDEKGFLYVQKLSNPVSKLYAKSLKSEIENMSSESVQNFVSISYALLLDNWSSNAERDMKEELDEYLGDEGTDAYSEKLFKLLCITYSVTGPKISSSKLKKISSLNQKEKSELKTSLLECIFDESVEMPSIAAACCDEDEEEKTQAVLLKLWLEVISENEEMLPSEYTNGFRKTVRNDDARINAYKMTVDGNINVIRRLFLSNSKTIVLIGVLLFIDILMLVIMMAKNHNWTMDIKWVLILLIVDFMLVFQVLPLVYLVVKAFFPEGSFTLAVIERLYTYQMNLGALKNTLITSTATMVFGTLLAFPLAWLVGRTNLYGRKFFRSLFIMTYMIPPYVGAMVWLRLLNPNVGTINRVLRAIFNMGDTTGPFNIYSLGGLIWVFTMFYYPYAFITISRAMEKMNPSLEEASQISGASSMKTMFRITLPLMTPSLIAGALLVFVCAMSCYGIPSIIGAPGKVHTVTTRIIEYYGLGTQGLSDATGLAVFLMVLAIIILLVSDFVVAKKQYITVSGKSTQPNIVDLGKWRIPITILVSLFAVIVIVIPFVTILTTSLKTDVGKTIFDAGNLTLSQWKTIFSREETLECLKNSLVFGAVAATIGIVVACTMSYLLQRTKIRGRKIPDFLITLGSGTPSAVIALGLIMTMKGDFGINIYNTAYILIIAYLIKYLMMGMRTVVSAMSQIHVSLEECSQISGASWFKTMFRITGPLILPSIAAGWFLIFIPCFYELSMTTLLYSNTTKTIGFELYEYWTFTSQPQSCAMAFGILMIVLILNFVLNKITKGKFAI